MNASTIRVIKMNNGDDVISFTEETKDGIILHYPMVMEIERAYDKKTGGSIRQAANLINWLPCQMDQIIEVSRHAFTAVGKCEGELLESYVTGVSRIKALESITRGEDAMIDMQSIINSDSGDPSRMAHRGETIDGEREPTGAEIERVLDYLGRQGKVVVPYDLVEEIIDDDMGDEYEEEIEEGIIDEIPETPAPKPAREIDLNTGRKSGDWNPHDRWAE